MSKEELLLAISDLLDEEFQIMRTELRSEIKKIGESFGGDVKRLSKDVRSDMKELKKDIRGDMKELKGEIKQFRNAMNEGFKDLDRLNDILDNGILPTLQSMEISYVDISKQYSKNFNQIETMQTDIDIIKKVVIENSKLLENIKTKHDNR